MHKTTVRFWKCYNNLPEKIKKISKRNFDLLGINSLHPSLHFKKVGKFWSIRISDYYRALAVKKDDDYIWLWIGNHNDYDEMIKKT